MRLLRPQSPPAIAILKPNVQSLRLRFAAHAAHTMYVSKPLGVALRRRKWLATLAATPVVALCVLCEVVAELTDAATVAVLALCVVAFVVPLMHKDGIVAVLAAVATLGTSDVNGALALNLVALPTLHLMATLGTKGRDVRWMPVSYLHAVLAVTVHFDTWHVRLALAVYALLALDAAPKRAHFDTWFYSQWIAVGAMLTSSGHNPLVSGVQTPHGVTVSRAADPTAVLFALLFGSIVFRTLLRKIAVGVHVAHHTPTLLIDSHAPIDRRLLAIVLTCCRR